MRLLSAPQGAPLRGPWGQLPKRGPDQLLFVGPNVILPWTHHRFPESTTEPSNMDPLHCDPKRATEFQLAANRSQNLDLPDALHSAKENATLRDPQFQVTILPYHLRRRAVSTLRWAGGGRT